jgi:hypothetical protein
MFSSIRTIHTSFTALMLIFTWPFYWLLNKFFIFLYLFTLLSVLVLIFHRTVFILNSIVWKSCSWGFFQWVAFLICLSLIELVISFPLLSFNLLSFNIKSSPAWFPESKSIDYMIALRVVSTFPPTKVFLLNFQTISFLIIPWTWPIPYLFVASRFIYVGGRWFVVWVVFIVFWVSLRVYHFECRVMNWSFWVCWFITGVIRWVVGTWFLTYWWLRSEFCPYW